VGNDFLSRLDPDPRLAEEKLRAFCEKLIHFFEARGCWEPADLAQETILRATRRFAEEADVTVDPRAYCWGIAKNLLLESRRRRCEVDLPEDLAGPWRPVGLNPIENRLLIRRYLAVLPQEDRQLLVRYYSAPEDRQTMAARLGLSGNALRIRISRIKDNLRRWMQECTHPADSQP
jgi:DNA-directed RNA polymerase specialized sigma24 family protein